jgi:hypothetical protein
MQLYPQERGGIWMKSILILIAEGAAMVGALAVAAVGIADANAGDD